MIKTQHPYIDDFNVTHENLVKTYTTDPKKVLQQVETGNIYDIAIDIYPCPFTYVEIDVELEEEKEEEENNE